MRAVARAGLIAWVGVCLAAHVAALAGAPADWFANLILGCTAAALVAYWAGPGRKVVGTERPVGWVRGGLFAVGLLYAMLFGLVMIWYSGGGVPGGEPGERYLHSHGKKLRDISDEEYEQRRQDSRRQTTAAAVGFSWCIAVVSFFPPMRKPTVPPPADTPPAPSPAPAPPARSTPADDERTPAAPPWSRRGSG